MRTALHEQRVCGYAAPSGAAPISHYANRFSHNRKHQEDGGKDGENKAGEKGDRKRMVRWTAKRAKKWRKEEEADKRPATVVQPETRGGRLGSNLTGGLRAVPGKSEKGGGRQLLARVCDVGTGETATANKSGMVRASIG